MKTLVLIITLILPSIATFGQSAKDEKEIRGLIQKMEDMWNVQDYSYFGNDSFFINDAILINPVGMYWKNRDEIVIGTGVFAKTLFKYEHVKYNIKNIRFLSPTVSQVVVQTLDTIKEDYTWPDGRISKKGETGEVMVLFAFVKNDAGWRIASEQVTTINPSAAPHNPVKSN